MKLKKSAIYSIKLENDKYFYIYHITSGDIGSLLKVINYISDGIDNDIYRIIREPSIYDDEFIIGYLDLDYDRLSFVGQVSEDYEKLMNRSFFTRHSIKCGSIKESFIGDVVELSRRFENAERYIFDDWYIEECKIVSLKGKFDIKHEHFVGQLPKKYMHCFNSMIFPHIDDFIQMLVEGKDRNTMLSSVYQ